MELEIHKKSLEGANKNGTESDHEHAVYKVFWGVGGGGGIYMNVNWKKKKM